MASIAFYYPLDEERVAADAWSRERGIDVDCYNFDLLDSTVETAKGHKAVCYRQRVPISADGSLYDRLAEYGVGHIGLRSAGLDTVDIRRAHALGMKVTNVPSYSPPAVAELVLTHVMTLVRQLNLFADRAAHNDYIVSGLMSPELSELTIGIIGVGRIGSQVARIFHALGATVIGNDIHENHEFDDILTFVSKDELFARADVVTMHTWLDEHTRHLINADTLRRMKPTAYLVNASRGPVVDTDALIDALDAGVIRGAALDVVEGEATLYNKTYDGRIPDLRYQHLQDMPNVIISPHVGFFTDIAVHNMVFEALDDAWTIIQGGTSPHEIHFDE
ncbi:D-2-hydroxyacid dehydrogenase [Bifidobacterium amazonense]|uniref:D-2-hydroxyacid dehydrogenase n=1 Tax=Bifidobacterium amazonense TaxID=2809027 RepID=A0ABS9VSK1_9BIFI|nr:NAD(P)-dependent oxidoreductase [Bifidobacterium amazonense]MCH9274901.1 D-2-hydroxyacid dehydrogenase [Bifidobacterium amazonense]